MAPHLQPEIVTLSTAIVPETGQLPGFCLSAQLADEIVPWHNFNLVGLSATSLEFNLAIAGQEPKSPRAGVFPIEGAR